LPSELNLPLNRFKKTLPTSQKAPESGKKIVGTAPVMTASSLPGLLSFT
jgi:hypothetical protein